MRTKFLLVTICLFVAGCAGFPRGSADISPVQAVMAAAEKPTSGTFRLTVRATGRQDGRLYLNSEPDYRDQRNLSIEIPQHVVGELARKLGGDPGEVLKGKVIRVKGTARRVTIWFTFQGIRSDKYYYQTHVRVIDASQLTIP